MKNKSSYYKILHLTAEEGWFNHPEIVKVKQKTTENLLPFKFFIFVYHAMIKYR